MLKRPWLAKYPEVVPKKLLIDKRTTLVDLLENSFSRYKNLPMLESMGKILRYKDVDLLSQRFASYIQNFTNIKPGDNVAIQLTNLLQYPVAAIGLIRSGVSIVNLNPLYTPREMESKLRDANVKAILILENFAHKLENIIPSLNIETVVVTRVGDMFGFVKRNVVNFTLKYIKKMVPTYNLPSIVKFRDALKLGKKFTFKKPSLEGSQVAVIQYTGGTTGTSKGAMLTHTNIVSNIEQMTSWLCNKMKEGSETMVTALPLYHIFAFTINLLTMVKVGAKSLLIANPRNMKSFIKDLKKSKATCMTGVNTLFNGLLSNKKFPRLNLSKLKITISGGSSLNESIAKKWGKKTGVPIIEAYGLTEASPGVIGNLFDGNHKLGTIGLPIPNTDVKIVNEHGKTVAYGTPGDLLVKGPQVMKGYWKNPSETANVLKGGWLHTGDVAVMDQDGFVKIVDRKKDVIDISGFNVYPNEIEEVISQHPKVYEVAAIGIPHGEFKEVIKVFIVRRDTSLSEEEVLSHCKESLTAYKVPKYIEFRESLPKSNVGKVLRRILKEEEKGV